MHLVDEKSIFILGEVVRVVIVLVRICRLEDGSLELHSGIINQSVINTNNMSI